MANSKKIGNEAERYFSKLISLWLSSGESDDIVWRDKSSGSRATSRAKKGLDTNYKSDIILTDTSGKYKPFFDLFCIDTKSFKNVDLTGLIFKDTNKSKNLISDSQGWAKVVNTTPDTMIPLMPVQVRDKSTPDLIVYPDAEFKPDIPHIYYEVQDYDCKEFMYCNPKKIYIAKLEKFFQFYSWDNLIDVVMN